MNMIISFKSVFSPTSFDAKGLPIPGHHKNTAVPSFSEWEIPNNSLYTVNIDRWDLVFSARGHKTDFVVTLIIAKVRPKANLRHWAHQQGAELNTDGAGNTDLLGQSCRPNPLQDGAEKVSMMSSSFKSQRGAHWVIWSILASKN